MIKSIESLPNQGRIFFKNSDGTIITSAFAYFGPLTSDYQGLEVTPANIRNTWLFLLPGFTQRRLATKIVQQGHYVWIDTTINFQITGLKDQGSHTEIVGFQQGLIDAFNPSTATGLISEWAFVDSTTLTDDSKGLNDLTNINTVVWDADKPAEVPFSIGSALFASASSEQLRITDASQVQLDVTGTLTIAFRVKFTTVSAVMNMVAKASTDPNLGYLIRLGSPSQKVDFFVSSAGTSATETGATGGTVLSAGVWYSIACVQNGSQIIIYLNGVVDSNGSSNPVSHSGGQFNNGQNFCLGARSDSVEFLNGRLAHVFIFNQAKSAADILEWHETDIWPS